MIWKRPEPGVYRSKCGRYKIEKFDTIMRGSVVWWVLTGKAGEHQRKTLRVAKRIALMHSRRNP